MFISRFIFIIAFVLLTVSLALYFWQMQAANYDFSFEPDKKRVENFGKVLREFEENLPEFEVPSNEVTEELKKKIQEWSASSTGEFISEEVFE